MKFRGVIVMCVVVIGILMATRTDAGPVPQQDVIRLESRMNQLEQRLYGIETSIRTLEQQARLANTSPRDSSRDLEILRSAIQTLESRIIQDECSLAKLDERTLAPAARRRSGVTNPCRRNVDLPLLLPDDHE